MLALFSKLTGPRFKLKRIKIRESLSGVDNAGLSPAPPNALLLLGQLCGSRMVGQPLKALLFPWLEVAFSSREPALASAGEVARVSAL